jgi:Fic family protein
MKPPYTITPEILRAVTSVSTRIGEINARYLTRQSPTLRKQNKIKTIHSSLKIEGNTLSEEQITAILEHKKVIGPKKDILEVKNAIAVYNKLRDFDYRSEKSFLSAHGLLMRNLEQAAGRYRSGNVGIVKGSKVAHVAPSSANVPSLMRSLFQYLKDKKELSLIKSCVFHYEMEFIHPFMDGNGRMGRLWQTVILMQEYPVFEFLPFESLISKNQTAYYKALAQSDKEGESTCFIEYMLAIIGRSLDELLTQASGKLSGEERITLFLEETGGTFTRKDYMNRFKELSPATASRDLKKAVEKKWIKKEGDKKTTMYKKR